MGAGPPAAGVRVALPSSPPAEFLRPKLAPDEAPPPFDPRRDFQPVSLLATSDYILTVNPTLPVRTVNDVLALARAKPGALTFGSAGTVTGPHLCGELLKMYGKVNIVHVPYKGNGPAVVALMAGEVTMLFGRGSVVSFTRTFAVPSGSNA